MDNYNGLQVLNEEVPVNYDVKKYETESCNDDSKKESDENNNK